MGTTCDKPAPLANFDAQAYMGTWYEVQHTTDQWFMLDTDTCVQAIYSDLDLQTGKFIVHNSLQPADFGERRSVFAEGECG